MSEIGSLAVLNVGAGDICVTFNQEDTGEAAKAIRMLRDMQARGYAILVRMPDNSYVRAHEIDASSGRYVVVVPESSEVPADAVPVTCACGCGATVTAGKKWKIGHHARKPGTRKVSVPVRTSRAVSVARSAGG